MNEEVDMEEEKKDFWFPRKQVGYGWGMPCAWQGWVVMLVFVGLMAARFLILPTASVGYVMSYYSILTAAFIAIVAAKGERKST